MKRNGFTLIEMLVVIAILAIGVAVLFPVFDHGGYGPGQEVVVNIHNVMAHPFEDFVDYEIFTDQGEFWASERQMSKIYAIQSAPGQVFTYNTSRWTDKRWVKATRPNVPKPVASPEIERNKGKVEQD